MLMENRWLVFALKLSDNYEYAILKKNVPESMRPDLYHTDAQWCLTNCIVENTGTLNKIVNGDWDHSRPVPAHPIAVKGKDWTYFPTT